MADVRRHPDWRSRLNAYLAKVARRPFEAGKHDCALFVAGGVEAITGHDFARGFRGYRTLAEGRRKLAEKGHSSMIDLAAASLPEVPVARARPGDVAVLDDGRGEDVFGLVQGGQVYMLQVRGLASVPLTDAKRVFSV